MQQSDSYQWDEHPDTFIGKTSNFAIHIFNNIYTTRGPMYFPCQGLKSTNLLNSFEKKSTVCVLFDELFLIDRKVPYVYTWVINTKQILMPIGHLYWWLFITLSKRSYIKWIVWCEFNLRHKYWFILHSSYMLYYYCYHGQSYAFYWGRILVYQIIKNDWWLTKFKNLWGNLWHWTIIYHLFLFSTALLMG